MVFIFSTLRRLASSSKAENSPLSSSTIRPGACWKGGLILNRGLFSRLGQNTPVARNYFEQALPALYRAADGDEKEAGRKTAQELNAHGDVVFVECDVGYKKSVDSAVSDAIEKFGQVDILVNNAGIIRRNDILTLSEDDFDAVIRWAVER